MIPIKSGLGPGRLFYIFKTEKVRHFQPLSALILFFYSFWNSWLFSNFVDYRICRASHPPASRYPPRAKRVRNLHAALIDS